MKVLFVGGPLDAAEIELRYETPPEFYIDHTPGRNAWHTYKRQVVIQVGAVGTATYEYLGATRKAL